MYKAVWILYSLLSLASAYTLVNVTVPSTSPDIQYLPNCAPKTIDACAGAWAEIRDPRFYNGVAMMAGNPTAPFRNIEPYFAYKFRGSAVYVYQWMNASTATQLRVSPNDKNRFLNVTEQFPGLGAELQPVLAWTLDGLDPLKDTSIGMQHISKEDGTNTQIIFDYMIVTMTVTDGSNPVKKQVSPGTIVGAVLGSILACISLTLGICWLRRWWNSRVSSKAHNGKYTWQGEPAATLKFVDPSTEIEASERIAREGRLEEETSKRPNLPPV